MFMYENTTLTPKEASNMGMKDPWSVKQLVMATQQLHASRLYERFSDSDYFLIRTPRLDEPAVVVLMGYGGETFGLNVFLGPTAMASYNVLFNSGGEAQAHRAMLRSHMIGYQMSDAMDLSHDTRRWLKKAKVRPAGDQPFPDPMSIEPGKVPVVFLKDNQTRLLLHLVRGILAASEDNAFKPSGVDRRGRVLCVTLDKDTENLKAVVAWESHVAADRPEDAAADDPADVRFDLAGLSTSGDNWLVSLMPVPGSIQGDDRQPYMLVVCSEQSTSMWPSLMMDTEPTDLVDALARLMRGEHETPSDEAHNPFSGLTPPPIGLPARLILDSKTLHDAVRHAFEPLDIECINGEDNPGMQAILEDLHASFDAGVLDVREDDTWEDQVPEADDLEGWKRADGWLKDTIHGGFDRDSRYQGARALKRYFAPRTDYRELFSKYRRLMIVDSYAHWFATSYRSARNRPTLAEQWLDEPYTPDAVKILLRSVIAQGPSLYRVTEADEDAGKITFADLFTGELTIVTDFALSTCLDSGLVIPAKLVPVGDFHFFFPAGPVMTAIQFNAVMAFFDDQRIVPSSELFSDHPYLLGWIWDVIDQHAGQKPDIRNTDGHALVPHTAVFTCPNRSVLERFLADQPDYEPEPDDPNAWVWFRRGTDMVAGDTGGTHRFETHHEAAEGAVTLLGQLELEDGRVTLTTNSRERLDTARALLERVDGIKLQSLEAQSLDKMAESKATTDIGDSPTTLDEDHIDAARDYITHHYRQWLDHPLPALAGKTPRQAAKTPKLRQKLAAMVRAMPDPTNLSDSNIQINAPREMILKELGLD